MTALLLSGCESVNKSREYIDPDIPHLTTMTMTTTVPVDTYSEYMATYTPTETTTDDSNRFYYQGAMTAQGIYVDTMATNGMYVDTMATNGMYVDTMVTFPTVGQVSGITADTPMTTTAPPLTESGYESTDTVTAEQQDMPEESGETVTATVQTAGSVYSDTAFSNNVTAYTGTVPTVAPDTMYKNTSSSTTTTNGGNG